jgi:HD-GYP domain-containing protein (c-di-GMP phosphodiesterase class II)
MTSSNQTHDAALPLPTHKDWGISEDRRLNRILQRLLNHVRRYVEKQIWRMNRETVDEQRFSAEKDERDIDHLLEQIVVETRALTRADGGTLYELDEERGLLSVRVFQNDTLDTRITGDTNGFRSLPSVPLQLGGKPNNVQVSAFVCLTGQTVNIPDVYETADFDFEGPRRYDRLTGYRTRSMLVIPLINHEKKTIGVLQLINAKDGETGEVTAFTPAYAELAVSFASQAAVALMNAYLIRELKKFKLHTEAQIKHIRQGARIGMALSVEKNIAKLLEMIVDEARDLANADGGTLYTVDRERQCLKFEILQSDRMNTRMGGTSGIPIDLPNVSLCEDGEPNIHNVSSYVALTGETINIPDVYSADGFDFTGPRKYDLATGYRSKSMLVIPLKNHEDKIIGVLQLLNAEDSDTGEIIPFSTEYVYLIESLASQAAVALTNTQLIRDLKNLFDAFIKSIAAAIDEKSPYTGDHISRVVELTMLIAEAVNSDIAGPFKGVRFTDDEMEELRMAAWMHDVGKVTTPEYIIDKSAKLQTLFDRMELIETRFQLIARSIENTYFQRKIEVLIENRLDPPELAYLDAEMEKEKSLLEADLRFLKQCNRSGEYLSDDAIERIRSIADRTYQYNEQVHPYLTDDEVKNLIIRKGTLTEDERKVIQNHSLMTHRILDSLPFPEAMRNVPKYAAEHHEKLDGTGYHRGLIDKELPLQSRIIALADIFEALTAKDRPYKKAMTLSQAVKILGVMKTEHHIDADLYKLFIEKQLHHVYAGRRLSAVQVDPQTNDADERESSE